MPDIFESEIYEQDDGETDNFQDTENWSGIEDYDPTTPLTYEEGNEERWALDDIDSSYDDDMDRKPTH